MPGKTRPKLCWASADGQISLVRIVSWAPEDSSAVIKASPCSKQSEHIHKLRTCEDTSTTTEVIALFLPRCKWLYFK